ncbi:MAG: tRNA dihydrouridine synthase DusB [Mycoplasmatales bacterium]
MQTKKLKIGNLEIDSRVIIAPMAGVSNNAFKKIIRRLGAGLITTEMVSDKALLHGNEKTLKMIEIDDEEHPVALQLFGNEIESMVQAAKFLDQHSKCDVIDINMGCPAPKIVKNDSGSKILLDPQKVYDIAYNIKQAVTKPVMVKMRLGWDENHINVLENVKLLEKAGVDAIAIHGRTTKQMYSGKANWDLIKQAKASVKIPVIGNGDIDSPQKAKEYIEKYGVDAVMIGRAALGNPWIIKRTKHYLETGELLPEPTVQERLAVCHEHLLNLVELKGERIAMNEIKGHASWYLKGIKGANKYRRVIQNLSTVEEFDNFLQEIKTDEA